MADERLSVVDGMIRLSYLVQHVINDAFERAGVPPAQGRLLAVLHDRRPTMLDLARIMGLEKSTVTGLVDRAECRGLVARVARPEDRRSAYIELTDEGLAMARRFRQDVTARLAGATRHLSAEDRSELARLATAIVVGPGASEAGGLGVGG